MIHAWLTFGRPGQEVAAEHDTHTIVDDGRLGGGPIGWRELLTVWKCVWNWGRDDMAWVIRVNTRLPCTYYVLCSSTVQTSVDLQMIVRSRPGLGGAEHMGAGMFRMSPHADGG